MRRALRCTWQELCSEYMAASASQAEPKNAPPSRQNVRHSQDFSFRSSTQVLPLAAVAALLHGQGSAAAAAAPAPCCACACSSVTCACSCATRACSCSLSPSSCARRALCRCTSLRAACCPSVFCFCAALLASCDTMRNLHYLAPGWHLA